MRQLSPFELQIDFRAQSLVRSSVLDGRTRECRYRYIETSLLYFWNLAPSKTVCFACSSLFNDTAIQTTVRTSVAVIVHSYYSLSAHPADSIPRCDSSSTLSPSPHNCFFSSAHFISLMGHFHTPLSHFSELFQYNLNDIIKRTIWLCHSPA